MAENPTDADGDESGEQDELKRIGSENREHISLSHTVDVSDMNERDTEVLARIARLFEESFKEVVEKNRDYSWSFLRTGCKLAATDADPFETPTRSQTYGLLTRTGDKRERVIENLYGNGDAAVSDPAGVTAQENANYWLFMAFILQNPDLASDFLDTQ